MDPYRLLGGVVTAVAMLVVPQLGAPLLQGIDVPWEERDGAGGPQTLAIADIEVGDRVALLTLDEHGNRSALRVLWLELDGQKLDARGQGQGKVRTIKLATAAPSALALGDDTLALKPGDEVTIEGFDGKWAYAPDGMVGVARLEGSVLQARLGDKGLRPLGVKEESVAPSWALSSADGVVGNVTITAGRTTFVSTTGEAQGEPIKQIKVRDVRVNGEALRGTLWGEGALGSVSFTALAPAALAGDQGQVPLAQGQRVAITDFIGAYVVFYASPDEARIALEGYAGSVLIETVEDAVQHSRNAAPVPGFDWQPREATAGQAVKFFDRSTDRDGIIVQRSWSFGDGSVSNESNPVHVYEDDGVFAVLLRVMDNSLVERLELVNLTILNAPPQASWRSTPAQPTTHDAVQFADESKDLDGRIVAWHWDFGDGQQSDAQHPAHRFAANGPYNVTLTVKDDDGATDQAARVLEVRNQPPSARFSWLPAQPTSGQTVQFHDDSTDVDGAIVARSWDFGDGARSSEAEPQHAFLRKGPRRVILEVTDDDGAATKYEAVVDVRNAPPIASFRVSPDPPAEGQAAKFVDTSSDPDGRVLERTWSFGDGSVSNQAEPEHTYALGGNITVALTVTDDDGARTTLLRSLEINRRPVASFLVSPQPTTEEPTQFTDTSVDPDGHLAAWTWTFGDGGASNERSPSHSYTRAGWYNVTLRATDDQGGVGTLTKAINVSGRGPRADFTWSPANPTTNDTITFRDASNATDSPIRSWSWSFTDGGPEIAGSVASRRFEQPGDWPVTLTVIDDQGRTSSEVKVVHVNAAPVAAFGFSPFVPSTGAPVQFTDQSSDLDGSIASWAWSFGDGTTSAQRSPSHAFGAPGNYPVQLTVTDNEGGASAVTRVVSVGSSNPIADFTFAPAAPQAGQAVQFTDRSLDPDGHIAARLWEFGDGTTSQEPNPAHAYALAGTFRARLTATDDAGKIGSVTKTVRVVAAGPLSVVLRVVYPDGSPAELQRSGYQIKLTDTASGAELSREAGTLSVETGVLQGTLPAGQWAPGDGIAVSIRNAAADVRENRAMSLPADGDLGTIRLTIRQMVLMALQPEEPGGSTSTFSGATQVVGDLAVSWLDGAPSRNAAVRLGFAWKRPALTSYQDGPDTAGTTDEEGRMSFTVPYDLGGSGLGLYLPGDHKVTARVTGREWVKYYEIAPLRLVSLAAL
ncbi:MAG TPA: PKD domain-containing protein [Candidatus Thermoplasmatota archaeon]|jgi:PKD repeat protein|nr:PKD domain-containing protein [Candidatus Thermoplasmatota archaeon]